MFQEFLAGNLHTRQKAHHQNNNKGQEVDGTAVVAVPSPEMDGRITRASLHSRSSSVRFALKENRSLIYLMQSVDIQVLSVKTLIL